MVNPLTADPQDIFGADDDLLNTDQEEALGSAATPMLLLDLEIPTDRPEPGLVPIGEFPFEVKRILSTDLGPSGYVSIRFAARCLAGEGKGRELTENLSLSPAAEWRRNQFLDAIHAPASGKIKVGSLIGARFWGSVRHEPYQDQVYAHIDAYLVGPPITDVNRTEAVAQRLTDNPGLDSDPEPAPRARTRQVKRAVQRELPGMDDLPF